MAKLSLSVRADVPKSLNLSVTFKQGNLRVGYLRSYEGQASMRVDVFIPARDFRPGGIPNASWVVNGTWDAGVSVYTSDSFVLPNPLQTAAWPPQSLKHGRYGVSAYLLLTSIPRELDRPRGGSSWAPFSLYSLATY